MRTTLVLGALALVLASCAWLRPTRQVLSEQDRSIVFPNFSGQSAIKVGAGVGPYELDGVVLQAILVATRDFLPPAAKDQPCQDRLEAHRYRVIRSGNIVFVQIEDDDEFCGSKYLSLDTGAQYAISTNGTILRRLMGSEPEAPEPQDGGQGQNPPSTPDGGSPTAPDASL